MRSPVVWLGVVLLLLGRVAQADEPQPTQVPAQTPPAASVQQPKDSRYEVKGARLGGPAAAVQLLAEDDADKEPLFRFRGIDRALKPWFDWKHCINEKHGFQFGIAYTALYQNASDAPAGAEDTAASGILRISGAWTLIKPTSKDVGKIVFSVDHRHAYGDLAPSDLGFAVGYLGIPGTLFKDTGLVLGDLNWQQSFHCGRGGFIIGRYDPNDFFDVLGYANPWTTFQNAAVLFNASIALPDWSTGAGIGYWITDQVYAKATANDANGTAVDTRLFGGFDELYKAAEIGWSPSADARYFTNVHVMGWHADERVAAGVEESYGVTFAVNHTICERWMPFFRAGWSEGSAPLYNRSVTAGLIHYFPSRSDLTGIAVNWGRPPDRSLRDQVTTEVFYRIQLAENAALTPSLQWLHDPALTAATDDIFIFGLRFRLTL